MVPTSHLDLSKTQQLLSQRSPLLWGCHLVPETVWLLPKACPTTLSGNHSSSVLVIYVQKKQKGTKRKTRQAKALENARRAPRTFLEIIHEANLESLSPHVPTYLRAAVGPPSSSRRYFCTVCGFIATYTCVRCGVRFCSCRCQVIHNDTRCLKFVT